MEWIGQHIWDQVSRFRNDIILKEYTSGTVTIADVQDSGTTFNDNDTSLMTAAAIDNRIAALVTAEDLDLTADSGTAAVDLNSQALAVSGGTGITTAATGQAVTVNLDATHSGITSIYSDELSVGRNVNSKLSFAVDETVAVVIGGTEQLRFVDGVIKPRTTNDIDLGTSLLEFKDAYFDGTVTSDAFAGPLTGDLTGEVVTVSQPNITTLAGVTSIGTDGDTLTLLADDIMISNATSAKPVLTLKTTHTDKDQSAELQFLKDAADTEDGEDLGKITFYGEDEGNNNTQFAEIKAEISESAETDEAGKLTLSVAESDGTTTTLSPGLILEGEHATDGEVDVTIGNGAGSVVTIPGDIDLAGDIDVDGTLETDALTIGGSALTSIFYARSTISFVGQASMISSGNWVTTGQNGISNHTWNQDMGVNHETNGGDAGSLAKQYGHMGVRMPYACTIERISCAIRNASGNRQVTVGLFCARAADNTGGTGLPVAWGTNTATAPLLQIHADSNYGDGTSYSNRPTYAEDSTDVVMAAGDLFYPAIKLTGVTSSGDTDTVMASFTVGIKTLIV